MTAKQTIDFKDHLRITAWLDAALKKEKEKYKKCPVTPDVRLLVTRPRRDGAMLLPAIFYSNSH